MTTSISVSSKAQSNGWSHSFWDCCSPAKIGFLGWCCPCVLYGKAQSQFNARDSERSIYLNSDCCLYAATHACGLHWVFLSRERGKIRKRYGIEGGTFSDCVQAACCSCCTLIQQEKEIEKRSRVSQEGYQQPTEMAYPQP
ncbi:PLAC8 family-domain-containing protein [Aspergillus tamarii]|uniref:PLAC8 family-domain-containing protein n=1 Tax=Aspergillus tamarii TaxID=41984 RepID=A0A5N6VCI2_ASPTM|nr:PLAC8 family-domain-containing protein [Aspergillus tamarii]